MIELWHGARAEMRSGINGLAAKVQTALEEDPFSGRVFVFRGRRCDLIKLLWWSDDGLCLLADIPCLGITQAASTLSGSTKT